jgi:hypothetical protein
MILVRLTGGHLGITMKIRQTIAASAIALIATSLSAANAAVYDFSFLADDGSYLANGKFTTEDTKLVVAPAGYLITGITGTVTHVTPLVTTIENIANLVMPTSPAIFPNQGTSPSGAFWIDNTFFPTTSPYIDLWGVAFTTGGGNEWNLWANNWNPTQGAPTIPTSYSLYEYVPGSGYIVTKVSGPEGVTISAVPEPATWAMLLLGFLGVGFMVRGARRKDAVAVA